MVKIEIVLENFGAKLTGEGSFVLGLTPEEYKKIILAKLITGEWQMQYEKLRATLSEASAEKLAALGATVQKNLPW
jgi:hypothetical protein